ncbi:hypothetical protein BC830DRAFT_1120610 [Chytriomyces sp. MP71]|nr:hypothetical protein BC830DRAFT_1120610 [Chytriomyces sp. MP71]
MQIGVAIPKRTVSRKLSPNVTQAAQQPPAAILPRTSSKSHRVPDESMVSDMSCLCKPGKLQIATGNLTLRIPERNIFQTHGSPITAVSTRSPRLLKEMRHMSSPTSAKVNWVSTPSSSVDTLTGSTVPSPNVFIPSRTTSLRDEGALSSNPTNFQWHKIEDQLQSPDVDWSMVFDLCNRHSSYTEFTTLGRSSIVSLDL